MKRILSQLCLATLLLATTFSCKKEDDAQVTNATIQLEAPTELPDTSLDLFEITFTNQNSGSSSTAITNATGLAKITLEEGLYNISTTTEKEVISDQGEKSKLNFTARLENVKVVGATQNIEMPLIRSAKTSAWVFKEIFISCSPYPNSRKFYIYDQFFEIYNNSDELQNAKGIAFGESRHVSTSSTYAWGDVTKQVALSNVYSIPEDVDYMVQPGESIVIATKGLDHRTIDPSFQDLSHANFECYDGGKFDTDVPEVPNLVVNFTTTRSFWMASMQQNRSYVLFKADNLKKYVTDNIGHKPGNEDYKGMFVDNKLVLDAVELAKEGKFNSKGLDISLDLTKAMMIGETKGKSFRRKVKEVKDGRTIYQDTNNSEQDFIVQDKPTPFVQAKN
ncbi:DUF4876 domain-containing protein [Halosquirtibacter laminarini]|uniref:DUF4876 domain-containing protein n=1 Tax=Halosquirtibacter laminarini TaxID=3374600 RepID=A0AC61NJX1_9BACT|nr:DUF4876 domain-containing protein [Prolixibacteraceae bacterium]